MSTGNNVHKPYVAIGPREDLSISVHKETFDHAFIAATMFLVIGILVVLALSVLFAFKLSELPPPPPPLKPITFNPALHSNNGGVTISTGGVTLEGRSMESCLELNNAEWTGDRCICKDSFYGSDCSLEQHNRRYFALGTPTNFVKSTTLLRTITNRKSFGGESCSNLCDTNDECIGFLYKDKSCFLLSNNVIVPEGDNITYNKDVDSVLYLRSSDDLHFEGRVFLSVGIRFVPTRFWLEDESFGYIQLRVGQIRELTFYPEYIKQHEDDNLIGIYCLHQFAEEDIPILLKRGRTNLTYIHEPGNSLLLPSEWKFHLPIYVTYIRD